MNIIKLIFQVGGPDQSVRNPVGLRFSFCLVGDLCQVPASYAYVFYFLFLDNGELLI